jgi:hypothetical protein
VVDIYPYCQAVDESLQGEPNMKVGTIIKIINEVYGGYDITYGKALRAK